MAIQVRRGNEVDFDPSKMLPGEWAVSLDTRYVRMCFSPGIVLRMATYEAFEADMAEIQSIMAEARTIEEAVARIQTEINDTAIVVEDYAILAKSYAIGGTGTRENEDVDNAKYYYEQAKHISQGGNGLVPLGTIAFENLPTEDILTNGMYNISNDFTSDDRFVDGGGVLYGKGSNVYYTVNGLWDVLAASDVKGVKGEAEDTFRQGNVTITKANLGMGDYGTADISEIGDGTVKGGLSAVNENLGKYEGAETLRNIDVLSYFVNEAPNGISVLQIGGAVNAYSTVQSWFTFYKMPSYGRIEQRPINSDMIFVKYMSADTWSDWDELAKNSDLANKVTLKSKTISGTTSAFGLISGFLEDNQIYVKCQMTTPSYNHYVAPTPFGGRQNFSLLHAATTSRDAIPNVAYSGTIWYLEIADLKTS